MLTSFFESYLMHQRLVNSMLSLADDAGICEVSQTTLAEMVGHSPSWVSQAIKRINTEEVCIEKMSQGKYKICCQDLLERGTFAEVMFLVNSFSENLELIGIPDANIAVEVGVKVKTVQMAKAYIRMSATMQ